MSCIPKLLTMKDSKEFLPVYADYDVRYSMVIEGGGKYRGFDYLIVFLDYGHRCAYVAIDDEKEFYPLDIICHGGITFNDRYHLAKSMLDEFYDERWIGFDASHENDRPDFKTCKKYFDFEENDNPRHSKQFKQDAIHRTYDFMERECHSIINQLIEMGLRPLEEKINGINKI
jgi:hypothetical protein